MTKMYEPNCINYWTDLYCEEGLFAMGTSVVVSVVITIDIFWILFLKIIGG